MFYEKEHANSCLTSVELSVSLIILKARYHLSHECINDILRLFRECRIDVPPSYISIKNFFRKQSTDAIQKPTVKYICPSCSLSSTSASLCSSCSSVMLSNTPSALFFNFDLASQIQQILCSSPNLRLADHNQRNTAYLRDIIDGAYYKRLLFAEQGNSFITLTMNVDGVSPNRGSDLSIWPIFLVINEIEKSKRFALENLIVAGVWPGPSKPSREQMFLLFADIVTQLKVLEQGKLFHVYSSSGKLEEQSFKVTDTDSRTTPCIYLFSGVSHR